ncbi:restriction endonuclease subunit S [Faecalibacterium wellingii]|uniref:Restriction endonuclease subunit S n=1 Tax=Faecalibacterium wellingii TaxID=2929491 RepID=A0ABU3TXC2_9FIRM|nr:restriction endonuclease subunit S [Faecalibacterium prausnitzii]MDU8687938.1 restriction endonuclease subunit S [Faecalibacterium prausnitzii]
MKSEWTYRPLGELVSFASGGTPSKKRDDYWGGTIPWISAKTLKTENIDTSDLFITEEGLKAGSKIAPKGSILLLTRGSGLFNGIPIARVEKDVAFNQDIKCLDSYGEVENEFIFYWLLSQKDYLMAKVGVTGIGAGKFDLDFLQKLMIPIPSEQERKSIVGFASSISEKIRCNAKVNDNLEQQAVALFKSWFVDFSLFGGTVPENWEDTTLENITTLITRGIAPKYSDNSDQTVVNQKCIRNHTIDLSLARTHTPKAINEKWLKFGDLLINSTGDGTLGRVAQVWFTPKALTVDSHVTIVRPAREELIFYIGLWGILHEKEIESLHTGSTGQTELPRDRVKMLKLLLPDDSSLSRFNSIIAPMASTIISNQEENQKLASLRDTLLPKLMSGEIDVSNIQL